MEDIVHNVVDAVQVDSILYKSASPQDFDCLEIVVERFSSKCFNVGKVKVEHMVTGLLS